MVAVVVTLQFAWLTVTVSVRCLLYATSDLRCNWLRHQHVAAGWTTMFVINMLKLRQQHMSSICCLSDGHISSRRSAALTPNLARPTPRLNATAPKPASGEGDHADDERRELREAFLSPAEPEQGATAGHASRGEGTPPAKSRSIIQGCVFLKQQKMFATMSVKLLFAGSSLDYSIGALSPTPKTWPLEITAPWPRYMPLRLGI